MKIGFEDRLNDKLSRDKIKHFNKNPILNTTGQDLAFRKVVEKQQANEYTRINKDREALCFMCYHNRPAQAQNVHICDRCFRKKPPETILNYIKRDYYGWCYNCATYQFTVHYVNVRVCAKCLTRIAVRTREHNESGGWIKNDPFNKYLQKELGKDWRLLSDPSMSGRLKR